VRLIKNEIFSKSGSPPNTTERFEILIIKAAKVILVFYFRA